MRYNRDTSLTTVEFYISQTDLSFVVTRECHMNFEISVLNEWDVVEIGINRRIIGVMSIGEWTGIEEFYTVV